jgi:Alpha-tubulin suppressor and related RCC1 domain-containing proteins
MKKINSLLLGLAFTASLFSAPSFAATSDGYQIQFPINKMGYTPPPTPEPADSISCGEQHCIALVKGTIWAVGLNNYGQLGTGDGTGHTSWVNTGVAATSISAGGSSSYAINSAGYVLVTGFNNYGQLGIGNTSNVSAWLQTTFKANSIIASYSNAYAIVNGIAYSVGFNNTGALAIGNTTSKSTWQNTNLAVTKISAQFNHVYAISGGKLYFSGLNCCGQYGKGMAPAQINTWTNEGIDVIDVAATGWGGLIIKSDGVVWGSGQNLYGALGLGYFSPSGVNAGDLYTWMNTGVVASNVYASYYATYIKKDGVLYSAGQNSNGQLGLNLPLTTNVNRFTSTGLQPTIVAANGDGIIISDGSKNIMVAGNNLSGKFGNGNSSGKISAFTTITEPFKVPSSN